ncbi:hypothetical protein WCLP8_3380004 [uncultured Gammaproteobacteria bacterium]
MHEVSHINLFHSYPLRKHYHIKPFLNNTLRQYQQCQYRRSAYAVNPVSELYHRTALAIDYIKMCGNLIYSRNNI